MLVKYGDDIARTRIAHNHSNPRWGQAFAFGLAEKNQPIGFRLMVRKMVTFVLGIDVILPLILFYRIKIMSLLRSR
jgi:hypothetical protein